MAYVGVLDFGLLGSQIRGVLTLNIFVLLVVLIVIDFLTGTITGFYNKALCSKIGTKGLFKHVTVLLITMMLLLISEIGEVQVIGYAFTIFYIFEYLISILENTHKLGVEYPDFIKNRLTQMHDKYNKWGE